VDKRIEVEEKRLAYPNMRGIMTARTKALTILEQLTLNDKKQLSLKKPALNQL
jgi:electron transfer flavoprotein beta subunit